MTAVHLRVLAVGAFSSFAPTLMLAQTQARIDLATGEVRFQGQPAYGALVITPTIQSTTAGLRVWSAGQFALANTGSTRSTLQSVVTTRKPLLFGLSPLLSVRGQDDPLAADVRNRRADGLLGVSIGNARLGASVGVGLASGWRAACMARRIVTSRRPAPMSISHAVLSRCALATPGMRSMPLARCAAHRRAFRSSAPGSPTSPLTPAGSIAVSKSADSSAVASVAIWTTGATGVVDSRLWH